MTRPGLIVLALIAAPAAAHATGVNSHVLTTDTAICNFSEGSPLRALFANPDNRQALHIGAFFPDTGYAIGHPYGEDAHWEPFIQGFIETVREQSPPPFEGCEQERLVAFLLGAGSHGLEDELFDTIFLRHTREQDNADQDLVDSASDFYLITGGHTELRPRFYLPGDILVDAMVERRDLAISGTQLRQATHTVNQVAVDFLQSSDAADVTPERELPWTRDHLMDPATTGSLVHEATAVGPYMEALWHRLHGNFRLEDVVVRTMPAEDERLASVDHSSVRGWIHVVFGYGVAGETLTEDNVVLHDSAGESVAIDVRSNRWGGGEGWTRLMQVRPNADLVIGDTYTLTLGTGLRLINGMQVPEPLELTIRTPCPEGEACDDATGDRPERLGGRNAGCLPDYEDITPYESYESLAACPGSDPTPAPTGSPTPTPSTTSKGSGGCSQAPASVSLTAWLWAVALRARGRRRGRGTRRS